MKVVVFSGAGISAESGIATIRESGGLWEQHNIEEVATPEAFAKNPELVLEFYNQRRRQIADVKPNMAHMAIAELEKKLKVQVITQNIDDLHERAGSKNVLHLHGCITIAKSSLVDDLYEDIGYKDIKIGDKAKDGSQLRPHVVWFGEAVPAIDTAALIAADADIMITVGSSLNVYPAAGLIYQTKPTCTHYVVDPNVDELNLPENFHLIKKDAGEGLSELVQHLT